MNCTEVTVNVDGKLGITYWFRNHEDADAFVGLIERMFRVACGKAQQLSERDYEELIKSL